MTPWQKHKKNWINCTACELCEHRKKVALLRGVIPTEVLFIGEAPGPSEDVLGTPFIGPEGKLLDELLAHAGFTVVDYDMPPIRVTFTNLVGCIPKAEDGNKWAAPPEKSIKVCAPRWLEILQLSKPSLVVAVGELAKKWVPKLITQHAVKAPWTVRRPRGVDPKGATALEAQKRLNKTAVLGWPMLAILHPAAILRMNEAQKPLAIQRTIVSLSDAVSDLALAKGV